MMDNHTLSLLSTAPFGVSITSAHDAKTRRQVCACAMELSEEIRMLHAIVAELSARLTNMQTTYALQSHAIHTQQELINTLGKKTTIAGRVAPLSPTYELPPYDGTISAHRCSLVHAWQSTPVVPRISPLMVLAESAVMDSREGHNGKREASQALYGEDKRQRYA
ncbi:uncharacterized protein PG986_014403 [Apiospora aurea]|uniref:Uncharacterized protein n=1 Tax=Apiospora aurea TaxID=335848 RepID=A0ABR1PSW5_9PEZI